MFFHTKAITRLACIKLKSMSLTSTLLGKMICIDSYKESVNGLIGDSSYDFGGFKKKSTRWIFLSFWGGCVHTAITNVWAATNDYYYLD